MILILTESNWLNSVRFTLSVKTGTLVFAYETKIIVLSLKWDSRSRQSKYTITWSDELPPSDSITAVQCIPITTESDEVCIRTMWTNEFPYKDWINTNRFLFRLWLGFSLDSQRENVNWLQPAAKSSYRSYGIRNQCKAFNCPTKNGPSRKFSSCTNHVCAFCKANSWCNRSGTSKNWVRFLRSTIKNSIRN